MKKHFTLLVTALCVSLLAHPGANAQESYALKYMYAKGHTYRYADLMTANSTQEMMGQEVKATNTSRSTIRLVVDDVTADGSMVLTVSADSLKISVKSTRMDTTMVMDNMVGKRTRVNLSTRGGISSREIVDSIKVEGPMRGMVMRDFIKFQRLPEKPVTLGEKWHITTTDSVDMMGGKMVTTGEIDYTLAGKEQRLGHECLKIAFTGKTVVAGKGKMMGMEIFTEGTGKLTGTFFFDCSRGLSVAEEGASDSEMTAAITGQQNMTIPISQSVKSTRTLVSE